MFDRRAYMKQYYLDNHEKIKKQHKKYRKDNPNYMNQWRKDNSEKVKKQQKQYHLDNREYKNKFLKQWRADNPEKIKESLKQWRENNKRKVSQYNKKEKYQRRYLGFFPLNEYFKGSEGHHISQNFVIYIPIEIHKCIRHNIWTGKNMGQINRSAFSYL